MNETKRDERTSEEQEILAEQADDDLSPHEEDDEDWKSSFLPEEGSGDDDKPNDDESIKEKVEETYQNRKNYTPLRFLSLPPLHKIGKISLADFDRLRTAACGDEILENIARHRHRASIVETIVRACHLLFSLVESGGLLSGAPEREITRLKINSSEAEFGLLMSPVKKKISENNKSRTKGVLPAVNISPQFRPRHPLYALGRLHLATFINFRKRKQNVADGNMLLPNLELTTRSSAAEIADVLPWLKLIPNKSNLTWEIIFRYWLNYEIGKIRGAEATAERVTWSNVARLSAWRLLQRESYPFLTAWRRSLYNPVPLPEEKINSVFNFQPPAFTRKRRGRNPETGKSAIDPIEKAGLMTIEDLPTSDDPEEAISAKIGGQKKMPDETNFGFVSRVLSAMTKVENRKKRELAAQLAASAVAPEISGQESESDLRNLLRWTARNLVGKRISTAYTYAANVLRALFAMRRTPFAAWRTEDVAEYLENYQTNASFKNVRNALELFDKYLRDKNLVTGEPVKWRSKLLQAPVAYAARDVLSEREYQRMRGGILTALGTEQNDERQSVLQNLVLLTLLRCAGLRVGEAAALSPANFVGLKEKCLLIKKSKTAAGLRKLPVCLLLTKEELEELEEYIELVTRARGTEGSLFVSEDALSPLTPYELGRKAENLMQNSGIDGETAHGLRHAFASSLFASFWLNLTKEKRKELNSSDKNSPAFLALSGYARPKVEGLVVTDPICLQQLMGHADLRVTFERYIHLLELAASDAVYIAESADKSDTDKITVRSAARLLGMDLNDLSEELKIKPAQKVGLTKIADVACSRLRD